MEKFKSATLKEKDNLTERWYVEYSYLHPETGKYKIFRQFISNKIGTKEGRRRKGYELAREINIRLKSGWNPFQVYEKRFTTIKEAVSYMLQLKETSTKKRTINTYANTIRTFFAFLDKNKLDTISCDEFNYHHAVDFMDWIKLKKKFTNRTYNNYLKTLRTFFALLQKRDYILVNPFSKIDSLEVADADLLTFTISEMRLIRKRLPDFDKPLFTCTQLIYYAALRPAEICRLKFEHIDFHNRTIRIPAIQSKNKKLQPIKIPDQLYNYLLSLNIDRYPESYHLVSSGLIPGKREIAPTRLAERWRVFADSIGLDPRKTIYLFKHTAAGRAIEAKINARDIQLHLRHHSLEMTQRYMEKFNNIGSEDIELNYPEF